MKKSLAIILFFVFTTPLLAQQEILPVKPGVNYGKPIDGKNTISVKELENKLSKSAKFFGRIQGEVERVCKSSGCFLTLKTSGTNEPIMVRFAEYAYTVPQDLVGKTVVLEGTAQTRDKEKSRAITIVADGVLVVK